MPVRVLPDFDVNGDWPIFLVLQVISYFLAACGGRRHLEGFLSLLDERVLRPGCLLEALDRRFPGDKIAAGLFLRRHPAPSSRPCLALGGRCPAYLGANYTQIFNTRLELILEL